MNKLYAFFALVFLTACGSPGFEGSWTSADETGVTVEIGETEGVGGGDSITTMMVYEDGEFGVICTVDKPKESTSTVICNSDRLIMSLIDGDTLVVTESDGDQYTFVRN